MDKLRRIIINKSEIGYMFSIKDLGNPYNEAAPINKVAVNGPADCAGLRCGDGVVAINSNLVKGKTYHELCNIIKSCGGTSLELTIIESYCVSALQQNESQKEKQISSSISTPLSIDESSVQKCSPILIKKKTYTYDKDSLEKFSVQSYNSAIELCSENVSTDISIENNSNRISGRYKITRPRISYKKATNVAYKTVAKSDLEITNVGKSSPDSQDNNIVSTKVVQYEPSKVIYRQAYKHTPIKRLANSKSVSESQHYESSNRNRRGSTPVISDSSVLTPIKGGRYSQTNTIPDNSSHKHGTNISHCIVNAQTSSPVLKLNRVGGLFRAPLSVDETIYVEKDECLEDIDSMLNSADTTTTDHSSATAATTESGRSSSDLDVLDSSSKAKFRHMHCSPMPYKSHNISNNSFISLDITPTIDSSKSQPQRYDITRLKDRPLSNPLASSSPHTDSNSLIDALDSSYLDDSFEDIIQNKDELNIDHESFVNQNSKHLKKLKNIFGDNYRGRSKTLDSDGKTKDHEADVKISSAPVFVKWVAYEGKSQKSSWKQYIINVDEYQLIFCRERSQNYLKSTSLEDVTMSIPLVNSSIEEEPEKRGRRNTIRIIQTNKHSECLIEFVEKSIAMNWLHNLEGKSRADNLDKDSRTASFKERHSLTVPNLYGKDNSQNQSVKSKTKFKEENISPSQVTSTNTPFSYQSNKSVIHQAMSRVKNLKHKFVSSGQVSDFERQQEEWFNKSGSSANNKLVSSVSYSEDMQGGLDSTPGSGYPANTELKSQMYCNEQSIAFLLPLHKWQRSNFSPLVPLVVELCVSIIETFAMNHVGLYRVSGNKVALDFILAELHKPISEIDVVTDKWNDLHAISGVLKSFFRNLPDGLFPKDLYSDIIGACRMHEFDRERRLLSIQRFLSIMEIAQDHPEYRYHRETLRYLAEHLSRVASRHSTNKMNAKNLAVIFAPSLMKPPQETNQMLVKDYKYKIQLIETLIKYHKWLFSPTLESACNIPSGSDDEDTMKNIILIEEQSEDQSDNIDSWPHEITDARPLVKNVLGKATKLKKDSLGHIDYSSEDNMDINKDSKLTLAELSKQAYEFNSMDIGYKEVDIDEECEKRKGKIECSPIENLKVQTSDILSECSKDIEELNDIKQKSKQELSKVRLKIKTVNDDILKTESLLELATEKSFPLKNVTSQLFDVTNRNLSALSAVIASPVLNQRISVTEANKSIPGQIFGTQGTTPFDFSGFKKHLLNNSNWGIVVSDTFWIKNVSYNVSNLMALFGLCPSIGGESSTFNITSNICQNITESVPNKCKTPV